MGRARSLLAPGLLLSFVAPVAGLSIPEPETSFYGQVIARDGVQSHQLTEGTLHWVLRLSGGEELILETELSSLGNGELSYQLEIPHSALSTGLSATPGTLALSGEGQEFEHVEITVDGQLARIVAPAESPVAVQQGTRAFTHRIDLELGMVMPDSDEDGLPDWWEEQYGLDPTLANGSDDPDGDGLTNLQEYLGGYDPTRDNTRPTLLTEKFVAYEDGTTAVSLEVFDADSGPGQLVYTLVAEPGSGDLVLRNARESRSAPDEVLASGAEFTQDDVRKGRLIFIHKQAPDGEAPVFSLSLRDEDPEHEPDLGTVEVAYYRPAADLIGLTDGTDATTAALEGTLPGIPDRDNLKVRAYLLSKDARYVVWDHSESNREASFAAPTASLYFPEDYLEYVDKYGEDRGHVLIGGRQEDKVAGGSGADILAGGPGDDELSGGGGSDQFVYGDYQVGHDIIADFDITGGDVIDLSGMLQGSALLLSDYVQIDTVEGHLVLQIDADGDGSGFTDGTIALPGVAAGSADLYSLAGNGNLVSGGLTLAPRITIAATRSLADENDLVAGEFLLTRQGDLTKALDVSLALGGSAENGLDYSRIENTAHFAAGEATVALPVVPFADSLAEPLESVEVTLLGGAGYLVGDPSSATLHIDDLQMVISIEVLEPVAARSPLSPAAFLLRREALLERPVVVLLEINGTAANGVDYERISRYVSLAAGQSTAVLEVIPLPGSELAELGETVVLSISPDAAYRVGQASAARVTIIEEATSLAAWQSDQAPEYEGTLSEFGDDDPGRRGVANLLRYAFGMDAMAPELSMLPQAIIRDGHLTMDVNRRADATDLKWTIEISTDLKTWSGSGDLVEEVILPENWDRPDRSTFRVREPITNLQARYYMRVRVERIR